ncbi:DUF488 domain-containing protein [Alicyclobacillus dauci]|uniref:DUF488 domain-containing protein n=1 Tax=Alicyclobacillus dauci TaxID=1475485 RepID=A0ABY6Z708_9BACL|nr:DUF488 domain-containing protein [Alicyclobacillus dauci]WAH38574.1 DUF488 domain-containing protein [Alicyclobacillus dauci]
MKIYTIGYEGSNFDEWFQILIEHQITCVVDIREIPVSRKRGFSKTKLRDALECAGIKYVHYRSLGSPSDIRKQLHRDGDYITFFEKFDAYLDEQQDELEEIVGLAQSERICLLCFEQNHRRCHRHSVAQRLSSLMPKGAEIVNVDCGKRLAQNINLNYG